MKRKVIISESQFKRLVNESMGVNNDIVEASKMIVDDIMDKHIGLLDDFDAESEEFDDYDEYLEDIGIDGIFYNGYEYYYGFFYDMDYSHKGMFDYYSKAVMINYHIIDEYHNKALNYFGYSDENLEKRTEWLRDSLYEVLMPVITHELTHALDEEGEAQGKWLGRYYKLNEEDLREILYTFSENEMNARVGSVGGIATSMIETTFVGAIPNREDFDEFVNDVMDENALQVGEMEQLIDYILKNDLNEVLKCTDAESRKHHKNFSILYDLFRNDTRLKNNRKLKVMFDTNSVTAYKYVYDFYNGLYEKYRKRIMRATWHVWNELIEKKAASE